MRGLSNNLSKNALSQQATKAGSAAVTTNDPGFGVYIHWPFCAAKCPYCDFNSHVRNYDVDQVHFYEGYIRELRYMASLTPGRRVNSIFFGGGTPSLMSSSMVGLLLDAIAGEWTVDENAEITLEANPSSVEAERFQGYASAGVNRVSLGVQSLKDEDLKKLGRLHNGAEARKALEVANHYFDRVSFDMIYARPGQTVESWTSELGEALGLAGEHLSLYQLTIEPGTAYAALYDAGKLTIPEEDEAQALYEATTEVCAQKGLLPYEVSNYAVPGQESRHNLIYWRYGDYAGVGPGAHGRLTVAGGSRLAFANRKHPETWCDRAICEGHGIEIREELDKRAQAEEMLLMGLRLLEGVDLARLEAFTGYLIDRQALDYLASDGLIDEGYESGRLRATEEGRLVLNSLIAEVASSLEPRA